MALFKILRGNSSALAGAPLNDGFAYFTPDDGRFYIDVALTNTPLNVDIVKDGVVNGEHIYRIQLRPEVAEEAIQAATATNATNDSLGHSIVDTYVMDVSYNANNQLEIKKGGGGYTTLPAIVQIKSWTSADIT